MPKKPSTSNGLVQIQPPNIKTLRIRVLGVDSIIVHNFSAKSREQMVQKQLGLEQPKKRPPKVPQECFEAAKYLTPDGKDGVPAIAFKCAMVDVCRTIDLPMTEARRMFFVRGGIIPLEDKDGKKLQCTMREDTPRNDNGNPDLRYRPEYKNWAVTLEIEYDADKTNEEFVVNLLNRAGTFEGIGEWRPGKCNSGWAGRFTVETHPAVPSKTRKSVQRRGRGSDWTGDRAISGS